MTPEEIKAEVEELMADRGYDQETAIARVASVTNIPESEVREAMAEE